MRRSVPMMAVLGLCLSGLLGGLAIGQPQQPPPRQQQGAGEDGPRPIPEFSLSHTLPTVPVPDRPPLPNETIIDASPLPRDKAPQLDYLNQTANFTIGQELTGGTSGASGTILADNDQGDSGTLTLADVDGEFVDGEVITDAEGGSATTDGASREGVWVLDFAYKPLRTRVIEIPGQGRKTILYLYYRVTNHTGKPRMFVPQFFLETDEGKRYPDVVLPMAVEVIRNREDPTIPLLGAVSITGMIPPSEKEGVDDAVYGVAVWVIDDEIARSDSLSVYVRGLSDGIQIIENPQQDSSGEPIVKYKTLRIDFSRPGDALDYRERELRPLDPPYEWIYD